MAVLVVRCQMILLEGRLGNPSNIPGGVFLVKIVVLDELIRITCIAAVRRVSCVCRFVWVVCCVSCCVVSDFFILDSGRPFASTGK